LRPRLLVPACHPFGRPSCSLKVFLFGFSFLHARFCVVHVNVSGQPCLVLVFHFVRPLDFRFDRLSIHSFLSSLPSLSEGRTTVSRSLSRSSFHRISRPPPFHVFLSAFRLLSIRLVSPTPQRLFFRGRATNFAPHIECPCGSLPSVFRLFFFAYARTLSSFSSSFSSSRSFFSYRVPLSPWMFSHRNAYLHQSEKFCFYFLHGSSST